MAKLITNDELETMREQGASVKREAREVVSPSLAGKMADIAKAITNRSTMPIVKAIEKLAAAVAGNKHVPVDLKPLSEELTAQTKVLAERPDYVFTVTRSTKGDRILSVIASTVPKDITDGQ